MLVNNDLSTFIGVKTINTNEFLQFFLFFFRITHCGTVKTENEGYIMYKEQVESDQSQQFFFF